MSERVSINAPHEDALVHLEDASVRVSDLNLLANCSLTIEAGERIVVLGANGAGKSTLLKLIHGLIDASSGRVHAPPTTSQSLIFQRAVLLKRSVRENIEFDLRMRGVASDEIASRCDTALKHCNLAAIADRYARVLSGGEQQRVALARAFATQPKLLLADEPTASLSPAATRDIEALLLSPHANAKTLILTTHNVAQAKRVATRIVFIDQGRIVEDTPANEFFVAPQSESGRDYLRGETL
jgi:tungstate transport system ATP-binding protein